jgi:hypothetical protein
MVEPSGKARLHCKQLFARCDVLSLMRLTLPPQIRKMRSARILLPAATGENASYLRNESRAGDPFRFKRALPSASRWLRTGMSALRTIVVLLIMWVERFHVRPAKDTLRPIPMPVSRRWREFRCRVLPVLTLAVTLGAVAVLWHQATLSPAWPVVSGRTGAPTIDDSRRFHARNARTRVHHLGAKARRALVEQSTNYLSAAQPPSKSR